MIGHADRNDFFTEFIHIEVKLFQEKMLSPNLPLRAKLAEVVDSTPTRSISSNLVRYGIRMSVFLGICRTNCPTDNLDVAGIEDEEELQGTHYRGFEAL